MRRLSGYGLLSLERDLSLEGSSLGLTFAIATETRRRSPRRIARRALRRAEQIERWVDRRPGYAFALLTAFYLVAVYGLSHTKLLWLDELITLHIARLPAGSIWHALALGADPNPPLTHVLVHAFRRIFGEHEFALRLAAVVGYWLGIASLFAFLRRRLPGTWAIAGAVLSMAMAAFEYSYESRSYGIFYGLAMAAVLCWSITVDVRSSSATRKLSLAGTGFSLALGLCANYFAVLAFFPIAAGELTRTWRDTESDRAKFGYRVWLSTLHRSLDRRVWITMLLAALPLLAFRPLIARSIALFAPFAWNKVSFGQAEDSYTEMVESVLYPILALLLFWIVMRVLSRMCSTCRTKMRPHWLGALASDVRTSRAAVPPQEAAAILFLIAYPLLGYAVASIHGGMLSPRFVIPVCLGFAIAGVLAAFRIFQRVPGFGAVVLIACLAWFIARECCVGYWYVEQKQSFYKVLDRLPQAEAGLPADAPIVIADPLLALTFQHYAPPDVASRIVFPVDFPAIRLYRRDDSPEENLWAGRGWLYSLNIVPLARFQRTADEYVMIASDGNWMDQDLIHHRYPLWRLPINTRAGAIGGFTPLCHGIPVFYRAVGDLYFLEHPAPIPIPFQLAKNLPNGKVTTAEGGPF